MIEMDHHYIRIYYNNIINNCSLFLKLAKIELILMNKLMNNKQISLII